VAFAKLLWPLVIGTKWPNNLAKGASNLLGNRDFRLTYSLGLQESPSPTGPRSVQLYLREK